MRGFVTDSAGTVWELPAPERWELEYGVGTPCDSFLLRCPWDMGLETRPRSWVGFHAEHEGERVFTGVVDECETALTAGGCYLEVSGRGMAALLLDNEALGQDYQLATPADILGDHVTPYGIEAVGGEALPHVSRFSVDTGSSEWTVVESFLRAVGGRTPRFDRWGRLILSEWEDAARLKIDSAVPLTRIVRRDKRYGVLSEILVRDRYSGSVQPVKNGEFAALGGRGRRVLTMPGHSSAAAMVQAGQEQLERSARAWEELELTLPTPFAAMPGQLVEVARSGFDDNGLYRAARSIVSMDADGYQTRLTLRRPEYV